MGEWYLETIAAKVSLLPGPLSHPMTVTLPPHRKLVSGSTAHSRGRGLPRGMNTSKWAAWGAILKAARHSDLPPNGHWEGQEQSWSALVGARRQEHAPVSSNEQALSLPTCNDLQDPVSGNSVELSHGHGMRLFCLK